MEDSKELIIKYFFIEHLKVKEIAEIVHTSSSYITKIIKQDERYSEEKKYRCNKSKEKRKEIFSCQTLFSPLSYFFAVKVRP